MYIFVIHYEVGSNCGMLKQASKNSPNTAGSAIGVVLVSHLFLVFLSLTLTRYMSVGNEFRSTCGSKDVVLIIC